MYKSRSRNNTETKNHARFVFLSNFRIARPAPRCPINISISISYWDPEIRGAENYQKFSKSAEYVYIK